MIKYISKHRNKIINELFKTFFKIKTYEKNEIVKSILKTLIKEDNK